MIACIYIDHLAVQVEVREHPELVGKPIVIGGFPHERKEVFDCSDEATRFRISSGIALRQAYHLCPEAVFLPLNEEPYHQAFQQVIEILDKFGPAVEISCLGKAFLDVSGTEQLFGPAESLARQVAREIFQKTGLQSQTGLAGSKFVSGLAALSATCLDPLTVEAGEERSFLQPLPIELLPLSRAAVTWFKRLGLHAIGQVAGLPADAIAQQLGAEGRLAHCLSNGIDESPVIPRPKPALLEHELWLESSTGAKDRLLTAAGDLLDGLIRQLKDRHQVCGEVRVRFYLEDGRTYPLKLTLKTPTDSKRKMLARIGHHLEGISLPGAVNGLYIGLAQLSAEHGQQSQLQTSDKGKRTEELTWVAASLKARYGRSPLKKMVELDPTSRIPERRAALVEISPDG
jgi:nucleotidyltransferase/DNA polymerase involved in DNA repair